MSDALEARIRQVLRGGGASHPAFLGEGLSATGLDAFAVGRLLADALRIDELARDAPLAVRGTASNVVHHRKYVGQRHTEATALDVLNAAIEIARDDFAQPLNDMERSQHWAAERMLTTAVSAIEGLEGALTPAVRAEAASFVRLWSREKPKPLLLVLAGVAGEPVLGEVLQGLDAATGNQPMYASQLRIVAGLAEKNLRQAVEAAEIMLKWSDGIDEEQFAPPGQHPLAQVEAFAAASRGWIEQSAKHLAAIAAGTKPFAADKAFMLDDAHALGRFVNLSLDRNEPWLAPLLEPMLIGAGVAPVETAKSAPSLAVAVGIAKAIAERPTAHALLALKAAAGKVRHGTLVKKFARLAKVAERRLAMRPDFILQIAPEFSIPKGLQPAVKASFEALYRSGVGFSVAEFEARILANAGLAAVASKLVWRVGGATAMPVKSKAGWKWQGADEAVVEARPDSTIALWHPLGDDAVADRWRSALVERKIAQPFNQVFRETYVPDDRERQDSEIGIFAGHEVDAKVLAGLAMSSGWRITHYDGLYLAAGDFSFRFDCGSIYPGMTSTVMGDLHVTRSGQAAVFGEVDPVVLSEVLRLADLLTSVSAFALSREAIAESWPELVTTHGGARLYIPGFNTARRRQDVLVRLFGEAPQADAPWVEGRYLCVKDVRIHLATGIARRDGAEIAAAKPGAAITLPYPDAVLEKIVTQANAVLAAG